MGNPDRSDAEDSGSQNHGEADISRFRSARNMRMRNLEAYANSFSDESVIDSKTAPNLNLQQRLYLRAYDRLLQKFLHAHMILTKKKEERELKGIGFQFPLPDPVVTKEDFLRIMRTIAGEGSYEGYERALHFEQKASGHRSTEGLIVGNEEVM